MTNPGPPAFPAGILGTGIDLVECERIAQSLSRFGDRFLQRIFLPREIEYCAAQKFPDRHFAARFAAKEAVSKAFGTGIGQQLGWQDIEVHRLESGAPVIELHGKGQELARSRGATGVLISLTHTDHYAAASAILVATSNSK